VNASNNDFTSWDVKTKMKCCLQLHWSLIKKNKPSWSHKNSVCSHPAYPASKPYGALERCLLELWAWLEAENWRCVLPESSCLSLRRAALCPPAAPAAAGMLPSHGCALCHGWHAAPAGTIQSDQFASWSVNPLPVSQTPSRANRAPSGAGEMAFPHLPCHNPECNII